ncbi:hypothetical protein CR513_20498, partial [Mucuna pruriens]
MRKYVHNVCEKCLICKLEKSKIAPHGLYSLLPITTIHWIYILMDFVLGFLDLKKVEIPFLWF